MKFSKAVGIASVSLIGVVVLFSLAVASDRAPLDRSGPDKNVASETRASSSSQRPFSERPVSVGYMVVEGEVTGLWITVGTEKTGFIKYTLETTAKDEHVAPLNGTMTIKPENFVQMHGTRKAMAAIANTLGQMLADGAPIIGKIKAPTEGLAKIDGIAFFEEAGARHIVTVRFEDEEPVFEEMGFVAAGCVGMLPSEAGGCGCTASDGGSCYGGSNGSTGQYWVKCQDSAGINGCTGSGGSCSCSPSIGAQL